MSVTLILLSVSSLYFFHVFTYAHWSLAEINSTPACGTAYMTVRTLSACHRF